MALIENWDFEEADITAFDAAHGTTSTNVALSTVQKHAGAKSMYLDMLTAEQIVHTVKSTGFSGKRELWFKFWLYVDSASVSIRHLIICPVATFTYFFVLRLQADARLNIEGNDGNTNPLTNPLPLDTWVEVKFSARLGTVNCVVEVIANGDTFTQINTGLAIGNTFDELELGDNGYPGVSAVYVDEFKADDAAYPTDAPAPSFDVKKASMFMTFFP